MFDRYKTYLGKTTILIAIAIILVGVWPLSFFSKNKVKFLKETSGIEFFGRGIAYSSDINGKQELSVFRFGEVTVEVWLEPKKINNTQIAHIFSMINDKGIEGFTIAQWKSHLLVIRDQNKNPKMQNVRTKLGFRDTLPAGKKRFITVSSNSKGALVSLEGKKRKFIRNFTLVDENRKLSTQLLLGNNLTGKNPWTGNILGLAVYNRAFGKEETFQNYQTWLKSGAPSVSLRDSLVALFLFDEHSGTVVENRAPRDRILLIPERFTIIQKKILVPFPQTLHLNLKDVALNILGFIPIGLFFFAYLDYSTKLSSFPKITLTLLIGGGLSLGIELLQVFLPERNSSLLDLACNITGGVIGVVIFQLGLYIREK